MLIAAALERRAGAPPPQHVRSSSGGVPERVPEPPSLPEPKESETTLLKVDSTFNKARVARVEFRPENITKAFNITPRTSPLEAFELIMNKISKGLPPEKRDTLVAKYAKYTLYRQLEGDEIQEIYQDEVLLSPLQVVGGNTPKFLFTDQNVLKGGDKEARGPSINFGNLLQESHMKEEKKADNPTDELVITERKFLFDTDLILEMVLKPLCEEEVIPAKTREKIFVNMQQVNSFHRELYRRFQMDTSVAGIASVFDDEIISNMEKVYTTYLGNYENALSVFYETRDHSEKFRKFLTRLSAESPVFKDKSLNNLLVTPMQRVCKYELLLKNIISQEKKRPKPDDNGIRKIKRAMGRVNDTLQKIDKRRIESDDWGQILQLEEKLGLTEPLRKRGRLIVAEGTFNTSRRLYNGNVVSRVCSVILFNDILLRTYKSHKTGQFKVLDVCPLNHLIIVDPFQVYAAEPNTITLCNIDPRGAILAFHMGSNEERQEWYQYLVRYTMPMSRVCNNLLQVPYEGPGGTEVVYMVDSCAWEEAFLDHCRVLVTNNHIILMWEAFGLTQTELIPLTAITNMEGNKDTGEIIKTNLWKEVYHLKKFKNYSIYSTVVRAVWQVTRKRKRTPEDTTPSVLATKGKRKRKSSVVSHWNTQTTFLREEWKSLWKHGQKLEVKAGEEVLMAGDPNDRLYQVYKGTLMQSQLDGKGDVTQLEKGNFFGVASFLEEDSKSTVTVTGGGEGACVQWLSRATILTELGPNPSLLAKFFAALARELIPQNVL